MCVSVCVCVCVFMYVHVCESVCVIVCLLVCVCVWILVDKELVHSWAKNRFIKENIFIAIENGKSIRADLETYRYIYIYTQVHYTEGKRCDS